MTTPDFKKQELIPAVIQDFYSLEVLMLGYMNQEAFNKTNKDKRVTFFSRSRQELWTKGETSGNYLNVKNIEIDCDKDTILIKVMPEGPVCHKGTKTCFKDENKQRSLAFLEDTIEERTQEKSTTSYTVSLLDKGPKKIAQKVGEEAVELALEAMDNNDDDFIGEAADLMYHYLVLLKSKGLSLNEVIEKLKERHK